ncbi:MAG: hypothetical protein M1827_000262 [Pycnora praestabilis]|nr:MAG: hypothetical protein M1827_000262 [Pycnora praestabilis]
MAIYLSRRDVGRNLSLGAIIGIAVAGGVTLFVILCAIIILCLRARQKRILRASDTAAMHRRLSGFPGGHLEVSENDTIPRPRSVLRRSTYTPYRPANGWASLSSREDLHRRPIMAGITKQVVSGHPRIKSHSSRGSWPLPRRASARASFPLARVMDSPLSAITESPQACSTASPDLADIVELPADVRSSPSQHVPKHAAASFIKTATPQTISERHAATSSDSTILDVNQLNEKLKEHSKMSQTKDVAEESRGSPDIDTWPSAALKPKPLFDRSGDWNDEKRASDISHHDAYRSSIDAVDSRKSRSSSHQLPLYQPHSSPLNALQSRAISMCSQSSGIVPNGPVPPLPSEAPRVDRNSGRKVSEERKSHRSSTSSVESASSSILRLQGSTPKSKVAGQYDVSNRASSSIFPENLGSSEVAPLDFDPLTARPDYKSDSTQIKHGSIQSIGHENLHHFLLGRTSWERSPISTNTLGLRNTLDVQMARLSDAGQKRSKHCSKYSLDGGSPITQPAPAHTARDRPYSSIDLSSRRNMSAGAINADQSEDSGSKRSSQVALKDVSGNEKGPLHNLSHNNRTSILYGNIFQWEPNMTMQPGKPSALKGSTGSKKKGHKRQNCVRISTQAPTILGAYSSSPMPKVSEELPSTPTRNPRRPDPNLLVRAIDLHSSPGPPSSATFDPQFTTPINTSNRSSAGPADPQFSPTLSMVNYYHNLEGTHSEEDFFDPSRHSKHLSTGSSVFTSPSRPESTQQQSTTVAADTIGHPKPQPQFTLSALQTPTPPSALRGLKEPTPPHPTSPLLITPSHPANPLTTAPPWSHANTRPISSPIRGPRTPPPKRNSSRSPTSKRDSKRGSRSPPLKDLRKSVLALRRMNSEVADLGGKHTDQYLGLGVGGVAQPPETWHSPDHTNFGSDWGSPPRVRGKEGRNGDGGMGMGTGSPVGRPSPTHSLYDTEGFLLG